MDVILFIAARLFTRTFWLLVMVTFVGVLMMGARSFYRNSIFKDAASVLGKRFTT
jgi:hypothetical protein